MINLLLFNRYIATNQAKSETKHQSSKKLVGIIARADTGAYKPHMDYLIEQYGFVDLYLHEKRTKRIKSSTETIKNIIAYTVYIIQNIKIYRKADVIVSIGWCSIILKLLIMLGVIRCKKFYWLGFFLHNPRIFPYIRFLLNATAIKNEVYIVHAQFDVALYHKKLNIPASKMKVLPYGDLKEISTIIPDTNLTEDYYFAGGYTDRDYKSLIQAFRKIDKKLIIVGSHLNDDLNVEVPDHITIKRDIDKKSFHNLVKHAKVCILPMKQATGASGHMVLLNYMKEGKAILATNVPGIRDYVDPGKSAVLMDDMTAELPEIIRTLESNPVLVHELQKGALKYYKENFGKEALLKQFENIILAN